LFHSGDAAAFQSRDPNHADFRGGAICLELIPNSAFRIPHFFRCLRFSSSYELGVTQSKTPIFAAAQFAVLERAQRLASKSRDLCRPFVYRLLPFSHSFSWVFRPVFPWF